MNNGRISRLLFRNGPGNLFILVSSILAFLVNILIGGNRFWIFLIGGGRLLDYGCVSHDVLFIRHQFWRLFTCGYLHRGVFHLIFNILALMCVGNIVEKALGTIKYLVVYHLGMAVSAAVLCLLFRQTVMVGASMGIFVIAGIFFTRIRIGERQLWQQLSKRKRAYLTYYVILGSLLALATTAVHLISFVLGVLYTITEAGLCHAIQKKTVRNK